MVDIRDFFVGSKSANFYKLKKRLTKKKITQVFSSMSNNKRGNFLLKELKEKYYGYESECSIIVFKTRIEPDFLKNSGLYEDSYAFLLFIEVDDILAVFKKNVTLKLSELSDFIESFEYEDFYSFHSKNEPEYETLSMKNMSISNSVIRARTLEAKDLTNIVPKTSSSRSIPQRFRLRVEGKQNHQDELYTLSPITSRISKRDSKVSLSDLVLWVKEVLEVLKQRGHGGFLDSFAKPVELNEILKNGHKITAIFIDVSDVEEMLANEDISLVIEEVSDNNINYVDMNVKKQNRLFHVLRNPLIVFNDAFKYRFYFEKKKIKYNKKTIRLESNVLNKIYIKNMKGDKLGEIRGSLLQHLNEYKTFSAVFDTPNYAYFSNSCYEDKQLIDSLDSIIGLLDDSLDFMNVKSEKEKPHDQNISQFPENSLFRIVEDIYKKIPGVVLVCDDMGNEWADHIVFNSDVSEIIFIHSKFSQKNSGASAFHEVVSQALKNIALLHASKDVFLKKYNEKWNSFYEKTNIPRSYGVNNQEGLEECLNKIYLNPNSLRKIFLVTPFLSKKKLILEFEKVKNKKNNSPSHIYQLIWLLSTFTSTCQDYGVHSKIFCSK